jgi:hypothetical protein
MAARFELHLKWLGERKISKAHFAKPIHLFFTLRTPMAWEKSFSWKGTGNDVALPRAHHATTMIAPAARALPLIFLDAMLTYSRFNFSYLHSTWGNK